MNKILLLSLIALSPVVIIMLNWLLYWTGRFVWHNIILYKSSKDSGPWKYYLNVCKIKEDSLLYTETGAMVWFCFWSIIVLLFF